MPDREYEGDPIDATMQYISERNGETVGGSTEDDLGEQFTVAIPEFVDTSELTQAEQDMIRAKIVHPELAHKDIAERYDWDKPTLSSFYATFRRNYESDLTQAGLYETFEAPSNRDPRDDPGDTGELAVDAVLDDEMLFKIINGDDLTRNERKRVFEAVLDNE